MRASFVALLLPSLVFLSDPHACVAEPVNTQPLLERSEDLESAIQLLGFDEVRVFSWRGGLLHGKINFRDGPDIKPVDLNGLGDSAKKLFPKGTVFDPHPISGVLVIAMKKPTDDAAKDRECQVSIVVRVSVVCDDGKGTKKTASMSTTSVAKGLVPAPLRSSTLRTTNTFVISGAGNIHRAKESFRDNGGKTFTLYELDLSAK
jgi:hypothetical protein